MLSLTLESSVNVNDSALISVSVQIVKILGLT